MLLDHVCVVSKGNRIQVKIFDFGYFQVDEAKENIQPYSVEGMRLCVYRYEVLWLPFLKKHMGKENLSAPLDIAWAWLMHALAPSKYAKDLSTVLNINAEEICAPGPLYSQHLERVCFYFDYPQIASFYSIIIQA